MPKPMPKSYPSAPLRKWLDARDKGARAELARKLDIDQANITNWLARGIPAYRLRDVCAAINIPQDEYLAQVGLLPPKSKRGNTSAGPDIKGEAPLISWVKAGKYSEAVDSYRVGEAERWLPMPRNAGPHTYCLRVDGESMTAPFGKSYPNGCIIFVDPEQRSPANGARVIAKLRGQDEVTFKQFVRDGSQVFLRPLNPQFPTMHDEFKIIGTVIGKWEDE